MGQHHHHHGHTHAHSHSGSRNILIAFTLNFVFSIVEFIGGYLTNSMAIYSDALHDMGDSMSLLFSYFAEKMSHKEADEKYTFGYRRFSILSAFINGLVLLFGSFIIIKESVERILNPQDVIPEGMLILAIVGVAVNSVAAYKMSKEDGLNPRMVMFHLIEDLLGWIAVFIVSIILMFWSWPILDSILSILISIIILRGVYKNLVEVSLILLQKFPDELELSKIKNEILDIYLVKDIHAIRGWSIDGESFYLRFHLKVDEKTQMKEVDEVKRNVKKILGKYKVKYSTIEFESFDCIDDEEC